jgi:general secretion pathway protein M
MNRFGALMASFERMDKGVRLKAGMALAAILMVAIIASALNDRIKALSRKRAVREGEIAEMLVLKQRYLEAASNSQRLANRMAATRPDDSPAKIFEEIGIKGKNSQIKPLKGEDRANFVEDAAELRVEGVTGNELVNLIYRLEKGPRPLLVKKTLIKNRFDDQSRFDVTLTVALLKAAPAGGK